MLKIYSKEGQKGFTLIELMIVIAIIGILAGIAIPQFLMYRKKGYVGLINSDCKNAYTASVAYNIDNPDGVIDAATLAVGGYHSSQGVTPTVAFTDSSHYIITCTGPAAWGLSNPHAEATVTNTGMQFTPAVR
jgi:type IV pilus assembly protein PilA